MPKKSTAVFKVGSLFALAATAFALNWIWEMAQMFAYAKKPADSFAETFIFCTLASIVDAVVTLAIYAILRFLMKSGSAVFYLSAAILEKREGKWRIVHWHSSAPRRAASPTPSPK